MLPQLIFQTCIDRMQVDVATAAARAERYVGVSSGGMDQAISMMGMKGVAKKVAKAPEGVLLHFKGLLLCSATQHTAATAFWI